MIILGVNVSNLNKEVISQSIDHLLKAFEVIKSAKHNTSALQEFVNANLIKLRAARDALASSDEELADFLCRSVVSNLQEATKIIKKIESEQRAEKKMEELFDENRKKQD